MSLERLRSCVAVSLLILLNSCNHTDSQGTPTERSSAVSAAVPDGITASLEKIPEPKQLSGQFDYYIDKIGPVAMPPLNLPIAIPANASIPVVGWAVDSVQKSPAGGVEIVIDGRAYKGRYGLARADVAQYYKTPAYKAVGFDYEFPASSLAPGDHVMTLRVITSDSKRYFESGPIHLQIQ
jgi:hypothetical protein